MVDESFIYLFDVEQIFFVEFRLNKEWHLVIP